MVIGDALAWEERRRGEQGQRPPGIQLAQNAVSLSEQILDIRKTHGYSHRIRAARRTTPLDKAAVQHEPLLTCQLDIHDLIRISHGNIIAPPASYADGPRYQRGQHS
jgi:hypothetical protein